ncbi:MAG: aldehyde dehydrogenase family protein [Nocardioidaceae bacterium]|nr:aldehyde dehydrogenase family protein [Nocardioidaceae bacterium]MCL2613407.1 aldehyde dehydrogenase family protein [Nocardioidaceae bacterium]
MTVPTLNLDDLDAVRDDLDDDIRALGGGIAAWAALDLAGRADLLRRVHETVSANAGIWAEAAIAAKGTPAGPWEGEEWLTGPYVAAANALALAESLDRLAAGRSSAGALPAREVTGGRVALEVLPANVQQALLFSGFKGEIWMPPGVDLATITAEAGLGARRTGENGGVGLVLGAGNISSIGPLDVLYELVAHNRAAVLKLNPTFAGLKPALDLALAPLVDADLLRVVNGGAAVGGYLADHADVVHVHITGSGMTHDAIVWGVGEEAAARRASGSPRLAKPITSELGGVSPIIVVPGRWSRADLRYQAEQVVTQRLQNSGHNCISGQLLILSSDWEQRDDFLWAVRDVINDLPEREPWYPGTDRKMAAARSSYSRLEDIRGRLLIGVDADKDEPLFETEYFSPVLGHTRLPGLGADFFRNAVAFANDRLDGTLGASIVVEPGDRRRMGDTFESILADLRYGTIGINVWSAFGFLVAGLPWGAFPGHTVDAVGSGIGTVHNAHLVSGPERSVVTGPFRPFPRSCLAGELAMSPKPGWFVTARNSDNTARALTEYGAKPGWARMPKLFAQALRG